ncbi:Alginate export [Sphingobium sp. YR657]|uniref:alginate export family protein n=1 Tax=Sphingobium sp. YR657 TaxID=1884366 RepID=UPI00091FFB4B|nr:alginate export family protein [Sphingobium sp. YR657]SHM44223.1 Alginate export [Sphingobium sp. YR657]
MSKRASARAIHAGVIVMTASITSFAAPTFGQILAPTSPPPEPSKPGPPPPEFIPGGRLAAGRVPQLIRWTEDWSGLADIPADERLPAERLRYLPLAKNVYLSLGGEARLYYTDTNHLTLGARPGDDANSTLQQRLRLLADLHVGPNVRVFAELGDSREYGEEIATPPNEDKFELEQAFVDIKLPIDDQSSIAVRGGRFEMPLGSLRLVGLREGTNARFLFQGGRVVYDLKGKLRIDAFVTKPVRVLSNKAFDNGAIPGSHFTGIYLSTPLGLALPGVAADLYYYDQRREGARLLGAAGLEKRKTLGARLYGRSNHWDYDLEGAYQFGSFGNEDIRAWTVMFEGGYNMPSLPLTPRIGVRGNIFSGDKDANDGRRSTFVAPFPKAPIYNNSDAAWFNFSNMIDIFPILSVKPSRRTTIAIGPELIWRQSAADSTYSAPTSAPLIMPAGSSRFVGSAYNLEIGWQATRNLAFRGTYNRFLASDAFRGGGGRSAHFMGLQSNFRF